MLHAVVMAFLLVAAVGLVFAVVLPIALGVDLDRVFVVASPGLGIAAFFGLLAIGLDRLDGRAVVDFASRTVRPPRHPSLAFGEVRGVSVSVATRTMSGRYGPATYGAATLVLVTDRDHVQLTTTHDPFATRALARRLARACHVPLDNDGEVATDALDRGLLHDLPDMPEPGPPPPRVQVSRPTEQTTLVRLPHDAPAGPLAIFLVVSAVLARGGARGLALVFLGTFVFFVAMLLVGRALSIREIIVDGEGLSFGRGRRTSWQELHAIDVQPANGTEIVVLTTRAGAFRIACEQGQWLRTFLMSEGQRLTHQGGSYRRAPGASAGSSSDSLR